MSRLASGDSAFATLVQSAPHLVKLVAQMRPTWELSALSVLDPAFLRREQIRGLVWDVDGTLTGDRRTELAPEAEAPFRALLSAPDLRHVILSNAGESRFRELGELFPTIPILRAYQLGGAVLHRKLEGRTDTWTAEEVAARLKEGARVIRKPSVVLMEYAVGQLGCGRDAIVMVGDQYLTDVAGANLGGVRSVKLPTIAPESFRRSVRMSQRLETLAYRVFHRRGRAGGSPVR
jgi:predicted HAD superfamily phosphohydrolase YqeG